MSALECNVKDRTPLGYRTAYMRDHCMTFEQYVIAIIFCLALVAGQIFHESYVA